MNTTEAREAIAYAAAQSQLPQPCGCEEHCPEGEHDAGSVPGHVMPALAGLAASLGYRVRLAPLPAGCMGNTCGAYPPGVSLDPSDAPAFSITLAPGMSAASTARVMCHELTHVIAGHAPATEAEALEVYAQRFAALLRTGTQEDGHQEAACELAAYAVCSVLGIGTGRFGPAFIAEKLDGAAPSEGARRDAERAALAILGYLASQE